MFVSLIAQDPEVARVYREGLRDLKSLDQDDQWRFGALMQSLYSIFQMQFRNRNERQFEYSLEDLAWIATRPGAREWWSKAKRLYSPEFRHFVDEVLESVSEPSEPPAA